MPWAIRCTLLLISPDVVTFSSILKACGNIRATHKSQEICTIIEREGLEGNLVVGSNLVDMYAECNVLAKSHELSDNLQFGTWSHGMPQLQDMLS